MSHLKELRQQDCDLRNELGLVSKQQSTIGAAALKAKRALSDVERKEFLALGERKQELQDAYGENKTQLAAAEEENERERNWRGDVPPDPDAMASQQAAARAGIRSDSAFTGGAAIARPTGRTFSAMFGASARQTDGWSSSEEFLATLHSGRADARLRASYAPRMNAIATGTVPADGGFSVPTEFSAQWLDTSLESEVVRPRAAIWPMVSDSRRVPGFDASDSSASLYGGFSGQWITQGSPITAQTPKLRAIELHARKLALLAQVANELIADGLGYDQQLGQAIIRAIGWFLDSAFLTGAGAPGPLGVLNAPCTIATTRDVASQISYNDLVTMFSRLHPASVANAVFVASPTAIPMLTQLTIAIGTAGSHVPVMREQDGGFVILTKKVLFTEKLPGLGTNGDVMLADFSQYAVGLRADVSLERSGHAGFTSDTSYYRGLLRADGMPTWAAPYTPLHGDTLSPFIVLAA